MTGLILAGADPLDAVLVSGADVPDLGKPPPTWVIKACRAAYFPDHRLVRLACTGG